jgi:formate-dependent nitrite reductase cytochrome c552 subunit
MERESGAGPAAAEPRTRPRGGGGGQEAGHGGRGDQSEAFAKIHFMKQFVAALTSVPGNSMPNPDYEPLLADPSNPIRCDDCHDPATTGLDMNAMMRADPGSEAVEPYRRDPRFMIPLMQNWVARLNKLHADRLVKPVTCADCHAIDPSDFEKRLRVFPPLMVSFVNALREPPENKNPASGWKPLLKNPDAKTMHCAKCHGETGVKLEQNLSRFDLSRPDDYADNRAFMIQLMEAWVRRVNRDMKDDLVKAVTCIDCHETDPRK